MDGGDDRWEFSTNQNSQTPFKISPKNRGSARRISNPPFDFHGHCQENLPSPPAASRLGLHRLRRHCHGHESRRGHLFRSVLRGQIHPHPILQVRIHFIFAFSLICSILSLFLLSAWTLFLLLHEVFRGCKCRGQRLWVSCPFSPGGELALAIGALFRRGNCQKTGQNRALFSLVEIGVKLRWVCWVFRYWRCCWLRVLRRRWRWLKLGRMGTHTQGGFRYATKWRSTAAKWRELWLRPSLASYSICCFFSIHFTLFWILFFWKSLRRNKQKTWDLFWKNGLWVVTQTWNLAIFPWWQIRVL